MTEEHRKYGKGSKPEETGSEGPKPEGTDANPSRLRKIHATTKTTPALSPQEEKTWSVLAHISVFLNILTGFGGPAGALVIWLIYKDRSRRISFHALQSLWYQVAWIVILAVGWTLTGILTVIIVGLLLIPVMIVASLVPFVHMGYAAYKVGQGVDYRYPFVADAIDGRARKDTL